MLWVINSQREVKSASSCCGSTSLRSYRLNRPASPSRKRVGAVKPGAAQKPATPPLRAGEAGPQTLGQDAVVEGLAGSGGLMVTETGRMQERLAGQSENMRHRGRGA